MKTITRDKRIAENESPEMEHASAALKYQMMGPDDFNANYFDGWYSRASDDNPLTIERVIAKAIADFYGVDVDELLYMAQNWY